MKIKIEFICLIVVVFSFMLYSGCKKVKINPNDPTAPNIKLEIKKGDGTYQNVTETTLGATGSEEIIARCVVEDPDGIRYMRISFSNAVGACSVNGSGFTGKFLLSPVPKDMQQTLIDEDGTTLDKLMLISEPLHGPFSCDAVLNGKGVPYGEKIRITCEGKNWSTNSSVSTAEKTVDVELQ